MNEMMIVFHIWSNRKQQYHINVVSNLSQQQVDDIVTRINFNKVGHLTIRDMYGRWRRVK